MKEEQNIPMNDEQDELTIDYRTLLHKCVKHWRWFAASVLACLIIAFIYLRYTAPVYNVTAGVLIQQKIQKVLWEVYPEELWACYPDWAAYHSLPALTTNWKSCSRAPC